MVLGIAIVVSGLSPVMLASAGTESSSAWLRNPCGKLAAVRHGRSPPENQLEIFISKIESLYTDIRSLHNAAGNKSLNCSRIMAAGNKSLKSQQACSKIEKMLKPLKNAKNVALANQVFYQMMQQIGKFFDKLKNVPIKSTVKFNISKRNKIYNETTDYLRSVMCEYKDITQKNKKRRLNLSRNKVKVRNIFTKRLPKTLDATKAQMYDIDFFEKLTELFNQSRMFLMTKKELFNQSRIFLRTKKLKEGKKEGNKLKKGRRIKK